MQLRLEATAASLKKLGRVVGTAEATLCLCAHVFDSWLSPPAVPADHFIVSGFCYDSCAVGLQKRVTLLFLCILLLIPKLTVRHVSLESSLLCVSASDCLSLLVYKEKKKGKEKHSGQKERLNVTLEVSSAA